MAGEPLWKPGMFTDTNTGATGHIDGSGNIYFRGGLVGRIDPRGNVLDMGGVMVGRIDSSGNVWDKGGVPAGTVGSGGHITGFGGGSAALGSAGAVLPLLLQKPGASAPASYRPDPIPLSKASGWLLAAIAGATALTLVLMRLVRASDTIWDFFSGRPLQIMAAIMIASFLLCLICRKTGWGGLLLTLCCLCAGGAALLYVDFKLGLAGCWAFPLRLFDPAEVMRKLAQDPPSPGTAMVLDWLWSRLAGLYPPVELGYVHCLIDISVAMFTSMDRVLALILSLLLAAAAIVAFLLLLLICIIIPLLPGLAAVLLVRWPLKKALGRA